MASHFRTRKDYPSFYSKFVMPRFQKRVAKITGLENLPKDGPYIIAANHVGSFDPPMIVSTMHKHVGQIVYFVTEQYVVNLLGIRRAVETLGMIPKREQRKNECLDHAREHLERGDIVGIFVEGMRNNGPALLRGRTGTARLALWTKAPVYPVGFKGPGTWSIGQTLAHWMRGAEPPVEIHYGQAMTFPDVYDQLITYEMLRDVTARIMREISKLIDKPYPY